MNALYHLMVSFLSLVAHVFFRTVEVVGGEHIPAEGPVIFVGNHPNSLLDPVLITVTCRRKVHFAAKDVLFQSPFLRVILRVMGAVPIKRRMDHGDGPVDNSSAFAALFEVLRGGGAFGIFPEGISHAKSELAPLKTGAARIALGAAAEGEGSGQPVQVVPCGLNYYRRTRMRSRVLVQFGAPLVVGPERLAAWKADEREAARAFTADIETGMRALTINAPDYETLSVLDGVRRLYTPVDHELTLAERAELSRRFLDHYQELKAEPEVRAIYEETSQLLSQMRILGVDDRTLTNRFSGRDWIGRGLRHLGLFFVLAPLALPGLLLHLPVLLVAVLAGDGLTQRKDVVATTKVITICLALPVAYLLAALSMIPLGSPGWELRLFLFVGVVLPLSGWASIKVLERQAVFRRGLWVLVTLFSMPREVEHLRARREALRARILTAVDQFLDPTVSRVVKGNAAEG
jgi:1-acyl-sn-glycerol-3-phosphate acyltransferase